jgi:hypothetical protein
MSPRLLTVTSVLDLKFRPTRCQDISYPASLTENSTGYSNPEDLALGFLFLPEVYNMMNRLQQRPFLSTIIALLAARCVAPSPLIGYSVPSGNILDYLVTTVNSGTASANCNVEVSGSSLVFPNAKIVNSPAGFIDCTPQLHFANLPSGYGFSIPSVSVGGYLSLQKGAYVEKIQVQLSSQVRELRMGFTRIPWQWKADVSTFRLPGLAPPPRRTRMARTAWAMKGISASQFQ